MLAIVAVFAAVSLLTPGFAFGCDTFNKVKITVIPYNETVPYDLVISRCIERVNPAFDGKLMESIFIRDQQVRDVKKDAVRNMVKLKVLHFKNCQVESIHPEAFRNVPRLQEITFNGNNIAEIRDETFVSNMPLKLLDLSMNKIRNVDSMGFANMPKLLELNLRDNAIDKFTKDWFVNTSSLTVLDVSSNKLSKVPAFAFTHTKSIQQIHFDFNDIDQIDAKAFHGLKNLKYLGLKRNKLEMVDPAIFTASVSINDLQLSANRMNYLPDGLLKKLKVKSIALDGNPMQCPCMHIIRDWLVKVGGVMRNSQDCNNDQVPTCVFSETPTSICVQRVLSEITSTFDDAVRAIIPNVNKHCVRL